MDNSKINFLLGILKAAWKKGEYLIGREGWPDLCLALTLCGFFLFFLVSFAIGFAGLGLLFFFPAGFCCLVYCLL